MVTLQLVPLVLLQPDQPPKVDPLTAAAVSVTVLPVLKEAVQLLPQLIPAGLLVTVPVPAPVLLILIG
jgi:hypothetical protein